MDDFETSIAKELADNEVSLETYIGDWFGDNFRYCIGRAQSKFGSRQGLRFAYEDKVGILEAQRANFIGELKTPSGVPHAFVQVRYMAEHSGILIKFRPSGAKQRCHSVIAHKVEGPKGQTGIPLTRPAGDVPDGIDSMPMGRGYMTTASASCLSLSAVQSDGTQVGAATRSDITYSLMEQNSTIATSPIFRKQPLATVVSVRESPDGREESIEKNSATESRREEPKRRGCFVSPRWRRTRLSPKAERLMNELFDLMDQDGNGEITHEEAKLHFNGPGRFGKNCVDLMFAEVDMDMGGTICIIEFENFWLAVKKSGYKDKELEDEMRMLLQGSAWRGFNDRQRN